MPTSQNLRFTAAIPAELEFEHPAGAMLLRSLSAHLATSDWGIGELSNWRDSGWSTVCRRVDSELEVVVSEIEPNEWLLQISPRYVPGFVGRLLGKSPSASSREVYELATVIHRSLSSSGLLGTPRWLWDGFPDGDHGSSEPHAA